MKKSMITLLVGASALAAGAVYAGDKDGDYAAKAEAKLEKKFGKVDANGDGSVTADEFMAYKTAEAEAEWAKWTENDDDGVVTLAEAKAMQAAHMAEKKAMHEAKMKKKEGKGS